jgi:hypothetical protein
MGFRSRRASLDREEGLTQRLKRRGRSRSTADHSTRPSQRRRSSTSQGIRDSAKRVRRSFSDARNSFNSFEHPEYGVTGSEPVQIHNGSSGEGGNATGTGASERFSDAFNKYRPPDYGGPPNNENTDSESEKRDDGSSGEESSDASTAPSSVGSQTPSASRVASPAPSTSPGSETTTYGPKKKNVHFPFPDGFDPPSKMTAFDALPQEEKDRLRDAPYKGNEESMKLIKDNQYKRQIALDKAREKYDSAHKASIAAASGEKPPDTDTRQPISLWAIRDCAETLRRTIRTNWAYNGKGGVSDADVDSAVRGGLPDYMKNAYSGTVDSVDMGEEWKGKVKPPEESITVALTDARHKEIHKAYRLPQLGIKNKDGTECTADEASRYYDNKYNETIVKLDPKHPLWPEFSNPANWGEPPDFEALDKAHLQAMKAEQESIIAGGGTQADVDKVWEDKYGTKVLEGPDHVQFCNTITGTHEGTMGNGQKVELTCGLPSTPHRQMTIDPSDLGRNVYVKDAHGVDDANWKRYLADEQSCVETAQKLNEQRALEAEEKGKAEARWRSTPWPLPSTNNATCLSDIPSPPAVASTDPSTSGQTASAAVQSWNGYSRDVWAETVGRGRGMSVSNKNAGRLANVMVASEDIERRLREELNLGEWVCVTLKR